MRELALTYQTDRRIIRRELERYTPPKKKHHPRPIYIIVDGTYWGERTEETNWCSILARDPYAKEDLVWSFPKTETASTYRQIRDELEQLGYTILSVTADGFGGIRQAFSGIPYQMCQVHMERIVIKGTTRNPILEAGVVLLALVRSLYNTDSHTFHARLTKYIETYRTFLNEKTINPFTGESYWTHQELRTAALSLVSFEKYLFTYEHDRKIPTTSNSIEGHFSHINDIIGVHRGISRAHKEKVLHTIFLLGTIAPKEEDATLVL